MNRRRVLLIVLLVVLAFQSNPSLAKELIIDSEAQFAFAREAMGKGEYERAAIELERFVHFFPEDAKAPKAQILIGHCYIELKAYERARTSLFEFWKADPKGPEAGEALFLIGESYYRQGALKEAEETFKRILQATSDPALKDRVFYRLGWNQMQADQWREASKTFARVGEKSPLYLSSRDLSEQSLQGEQLPLKDPVTAGVMAGIVPGLGHVYCDRYKDGMVAFLLNGLFVWAAVESFDQDHEVLGGMLSFLEAGWYAGNIYSAVNTAHKHNRKVKNDFRKNLSDQWNINLFTSGEGQVGLALKINF